MASEKKQNIMKILIMADRVAGIVIIGDMNVLEHYGEVIVHAWTFIRIFKMSTIYVCSSSSPTVIICGELNDNII